MAPSSRADNLRALLGRFDASVLRSFQGATSLCQSRGHFEVLPEHFLLRMLDDTSGDVTAILNTFNVDRGQIRRSLQQILGELPAGHRGKPALSPKLVDIFQSAAVFADEAGMVQIRPGLLMLAIVTNPTLSRVGEYTPELQRIDVDQLRDNFFDIVSGATGGGEETGDAPSAGVSTGDGGALAQYTVDVTAKAASGGIDPVFGRDQEIRLMIDIFARRRKNNPILVGEPGTGKTAIVEGLALRIVKDDVPPSLKGVRLLSLDLGLLQAGANVKGEFENRLKNVIKEIKASKEPIITFIDEAHTLIGAGGAAGSGDAANLLKPALARGELRTVAATTWAEYKKYFEKDAALERRFQLVRCDEPSIENAIVMLRGLKSKYEKHHKVVVLDEAVSAAVEISKRYISGRFLPDKAVDLLDTAAARVGTSLSTKPGVLEDVDRRLGHLDTAVIAIRRDEASGLVADADVLQEMEETRVALLAERKAIEQRWKAELEAVHRVIELRSKLNAYADDDANNGEGEEGNKGNKGSEGNKDSDSSHGGDANETVKKEAKETVDDSDIRKEVRAAMKVLADLQGESPLLHAHVDAAAVAAVVADWTGIPVGSMVKNDIDATLKLEDTLGKRVVGQDHALSIIAQKLRTSKAGIGNPSQPMGVFFCVGPSGVGKTEVSLAVADILFGGERFLTTINMSEFMEAHTVSQLKGSPPGYVGYGEGGVLTEAVRQHPYSVVLLDEVEKAHPDVMNLFYQVFDKGTLADGEGRIIDFKNTVIMLTSNLGTDAIQNYCENEEQINTDELIEAVYPHLRDHFKPALVARMTVIPFLTLEKEVLMSIAKMKTAKVARRLLEVHKIKLDVADGVYEAMADRCNQVDLGARQVDHLLDKSVLPELSRQLLERMSEDKESSVITMSVSGAGAFEYTFA